MRRRSERGFTLLELIIALSIVGALLIVAFGGLRVGIAAWGQGENRAEAHAQLRGLAVTLSRALGSTYPYRASLGQAPDSVLLFRGTESRLEFVTQTPPFPPPIPVAFTAVVLRDTAVQQMAFRYLNDTGSWQDTWDADVENGLPRAVQATITTIRQGRTETMPPLTVAIKTAIQ